MTVEKRDPVKRFWAQTTKPELEGKLGTTFSLANGLLGIRGAHLECPSWGRPEFYISGTYAAGPPALLGFHDADHILSHPERITEDALTLLGDDAIHTLPNLPYPIALNITVGGQRFDFDSHKVLSAERLLEIDNAVGCRTVVFRDNEGRRTRVDSSCFVSMADENLICMRAVVKRLNHDAPVELNGVLYEKVTNTNGVALWSAGQRVDESDLRAIECITRGTNVSIAIAQCQNVVNSADEISIELFAIAGELTVQEAVQRAGDAAAVGYADCAAAHTKAYNAQVQAAHVSFDGLPSTVQGFNFGQMHMHMACSPVAEKAGLPIKGLTGHGYRFLTFWDMDFHMFPYYLLTKPRWARKLLEYRYNQLPQYRENARYWGAEGAQVPWETGVRGEEETAPWLCLQEREIHISADAAYMFRRYAEVTGDTSVMVEMGAEFAFETARFYASRLKWNEKCGRYDLPGIGCPDQYHTFADNNVFISLMAQWNLEHAVELYQNTDYNEAASKVGVTLEEAERWAEMAEKLYIIEPDGEGIIEEFEGFFKLDEDLGGICETYCSHSQAVKQPDVLAAFIPFESRYNQEIRRKNWHYYDVRTLHGSSLSLPGMAMAAARCGLNDEALYNLHESCRMDLDDVNLDTERGVHLSGGALEWFTVVQGFGGLDVTEDGLIIKPNLPRQWNWLSFAVHWHFQQIDVEVKGNQVTVRAGIRADASVPVSFDGGSWVTLNPGETYIHTIRKD